MDQLKFLLKTSFRQLYIYRKFTLINIVGLSIGLTVSLLILLYVRFETSYENFNPQAKNIYRVIDRNNQDGTLAASTPLALSDVLKKDYPEINKVVGLMQTYDFLKVDNERYDHLKGAIVEKDFLSLFNIPLRLGNAKDLFNDPFEAVITKTLAIKLFGDENALGKTFLFDNHSFTVTGIINEIPSNSLFSFDYLLSDKFRYIYYPDLNERWYEFGLFTFVTFKSPQTPLGFENKLSLIENKYYPDFMKNRHAYKITGFKNSHLNPEIQNDLKPSVAPVYLWILSFIAFGILLIACMNFINITLASAAKRNVSTGIKKVNGASAFAIITSFFIELSLIILCCLVLSFILIHLMLPSFNHLIDKNIALDFSDPVLWLGIGCFCFITILISGLYPSIVLAKPSPLKILNKKALDKNKLTFQKSFVTLQFVFTIFLGIVLLFITKQMSFMKNHSVGFDKSGLIAIPVRSLGNTGEERLKKTSLYQQVLDKNQIQFGYSKSTVTEFVPGFGFRNRFKIYNVNSSSQAEFELLSCDIDENYLEVFGLKMIQGRFFSKEFTSDRDAILVNESAFKKLDLKSLNNDYVGLISKDNRKKIVGVISDINVQSLQHPVEPMIYQFGRHHNYPGYISLRLNPQKKAETIVFLRREWRELFPDIPFEFENVEDKFKAAYGKEVKLSMITGVFSFLAMFLSVLGLFALSALETEKKVKEIGIRKVNGARRTEILAMINQDFIKWIAIAFIIATPIAWYTLHKWLENFAYKTDLSWWIFGLAGIITWTLALLTVSWQSFKAASKNPVESLRYE